ncbi:MAG: class I SAM-dependent methyltransferase [Anaerolineaceae bacterium]|nr:class I SAM-dependent methyltransferase [Anaerolineaceae bacterium]
MLVNIKNLLRNSFFHPRYLAQHELWSLIESEGFQLTGKLLDVGCGHKPYQSLLRCINEYIGLDVPSSMHGLDQVDVIGTSMSLPFMENCFDSLLCTEVLEHVPEPMAALREMARVAKTGGLLLLSAPLSEQLHEEPYDFYRYTCHGLIYLLNKTGWNVLNIKTRGGVWLEMGYRFSSFLYTSIGAKRTANGGLQPRLVIGPIVILACTLIQGSAWVLNRMWKSDLSTIGYGVLAQKK